MNNWIFPLCCGFCAPEQHQQQQDHTVVPTNRLQQKHNTAHLMIVVILLLHENCFKLKTFYHRIFPKLYFPDDVIRQKTQTANDFPTEIIPGHKILLLFSIDVLLLCQEPHSRHPILLFLFLLSIWFVDFQHEIFIVVYVIHRNKKEPFVYCPQIDM